MGGDREDHSSKRVDNRFCFHFVPQAERSSHFHLHSRETHFTEFSLMVSYPKGVLNVLSKSQGDGMSGVC